MTLADPIASDLEQSRARILEVAESYFRRIGYHKTSVADIASELGMSRANVYRFFPSRTAINSSVCGLIVQEVAEIALAIARTDAPASKKLADLLTAIHRHSTRILMEDRPMHQLLVAAMDGSWATINAHNEQILAILKALVREGQQTGEFRLEDADEAARGIITAFLPFFHPVLVEQRVQEGGDTAVSLHAQIHFIMQALGKTDCRSAEAAAARTRE
ncbi:TetR/AcrR family transcriptional regulator [Rhizobium esperanzae]|uniref:AcrR family transcriptional regulator n=1 Tax=Rhizobium esperanzae TaxID=1967781 RepID=A0A7W6W7V4_9HYPH|nr:TetR family transcriptional regulator [Rhizobium esperanzae]MBB4239204.1 AcrR family transcriptional regulator [Rhizobium esperanzae]